MVGAVMDSAIIKAGMAGDRVRPRLSIGKAGIETQGDPAAQEIARLKQEIERLSSDLRQRDQEQDAFRLASNQAVQDAELKGRLAGQAEADRREAERLDRLQTGVQAALEMVSSELASLERLSALIALEALKKVFGDDAGRAEMVGRAIGVQLTRLKAHQEASVLVSREDFPDARALDTLVERLGRFQVKIETSEHLQSGACHIKLKLGGLDVGVNQQWSTLQAVLQDMAKPDLAS